MYKHTLLISPDRHLSLGSPVVLIVYKPVGTRIFLCHTGMGEIIPVMICIASRTWMGLGPDVREVALSFMSL